MNEDDNTEYDPFWITGKDLERHFALDDALLEFSRLFKHEEKNDRALVIVGAAFLDTLLEHILITFLVDDPKEVGKLLRYDQPLGTYGNRIRAAYCFGLIGKTVREDLRLVGKVRNRTPTTFARRSRINRFARGVQRLDGTAPRTWSLLPESRSATYSMSALTSWSAI